jgi:hypothetical protein
MNNNLIGKEDRQYKITTYDDERIKIQFNTFNPFKERTIINMVPPTKKINIKNPYMSRTQYTRTLRKNRKILFDLKLDYERCLFLTLTTSEFFD